MNGLTKLPGSEDSKWASLPTSAGKAPLTAGEVARELARMSLSGSVAWGVALSHAIAHKLGVPLPHQQLRSAAEWAVGQLGDEALTMAAGDIAELAATMVVEAISGGLLRRSTGETMADGTVCPVGSYVGPWRMCIGVPRSGVGIPDGEGGAQGAPQTEGGGMDELDRELAALEAELGALGGGGGGGLGGGGGGGFGALAEVEVLPPSSSVATALGYGIPAFLQGTWGRIALALLTSPTGKQVATYVGRRLGIVGTPGEESASTCRITAMHIPAAKRRVAELALCSDMPRGLSESETEWWELIRIARRPDALAFLQDTKPGCGCNGGGSHA